MQIAKSNTKKGHRVQLLFKISQHSCDTALLSSFVDYLKCGLISIDNKKNTCLYLLLG